MKKILTLLLTAVMCLSFVACDINTLIGNDTRYAPNGLEYRVNEDRKSCTIIGIGNCTDTVIEIPEKIGKYKVTVIGKDAFLDQSQITDISLPNGLLTIEDNAFDSCRGLTEIVIPDTVTKAGIYSFAFCDNLESIQLSSSLTEIPVQLCYMCKSLEEVIIPDSVKVIGDGAFAECPLRSVSLGSGIEKIESFALMNHGNYGFYPLTVTYNGTLAQWKSVERANVWIQEADCSFSCLDFSGSIMDVYE